MEVFTETNKMLLCEEPAIKSGGEGAVYNIAGYNKVVAKIYLSKSDAKEREEKICAMAALSRTRGFRNTNILNDIAWPLAPLYNKAKEFIGFGMSKVTSKYELDNVYSLSQKTSAGMTTKEKIKTLISLCSIVERLHAYGQIFGDFNPNNIKIDSNCDVKFVDSDSYHFNAGKKVYPCIVCAPGYVAPELIKKCKGTTYAEYFEKGGITFTKETDRFALAIHCFRMLMNGCHPYTCKKQAKNLGSTAAPSTDKRVEKGETPFFVSVPNYSTPDWAPDISCLPMYIRKLFERAFVDGHTNPSARPSAGEWKKALEQYKNEITFCGQNPLHYYWNRLSDCPYCLAADRGTKNLIATMGASIRPQMNVNRGNTKINNPAASAGNVPGFMNITAKPLKTGKKVKPKNAVSYWVITMMLAITLQALLGLYVYAPLYAMIGEDLITCIGTVITGIVAIAGVVVYGLKWSGANRSPYKYRWYDYILSQLTGIGFVVGTVVAVALIIVIVVVVMYILALIAIFALFGAFLGGLASG